VYNLLISLGISIGVGVAWTLLDLWQGWAMGTWLGILAFIASFVVIGRILKRKIEPAVQHAQKQAEAGKAQLAIRSLEDLLPLGNWQPLLRGQLHAQLGILRYSLGEEEKALQHLAKASERVAEAQLFRASLLFRQGNFDEAKKVLDLTSRFNKKHVLLHNVYAYMLEKKGQRAEAIAQLNALLKHEKNNEATKDNLLRLQNDKKMNMKRFGMNWYALQLEKPPTSLGQQRPPRAGFRQKKRKK